MNNLHVRRPPTVACAQKTPVRSHDSIFLSTRLLCLAELLLTPLRPSNEREHPTTN